MLSSPVSLSTLIFKVHCNAILASALIKESITDLRIEPQMICPSRCQWKTVFASGNRRFLLSGYHFFAMRTAQSFYTYFLLWTQTSSHHLCWDSEVERALFISQVRVFTHKIVHKFIIIWFHLAYTGTSSRSEVTKFDNHITATSSCKMPFDA